MNMSYAIAIRCPKQSHKCLYQYISSNKSMQTGLVCFGWAVFKGEIFGLGSSRVSVELSEEVNDLYFKTFMICYGCM